jgi:rRNA maturation protein Nop10
MARVGEPRTKAALSRDWEGHEFTRADKPPVCGTTEVVPFPWRRSPRRLVAAYAYILESHGAQAS